MSTYLSALDIGSNSSHLIIVKLKEDNSFEIVHRERVIFRPGTFKDLITLSPYITENETETAIELIKNFNSICKKYNASLTAVATSAIREASNKDFFVKRILDETGVLIEVIDGKREAELIYKGIYSSLKIKDKKLFCIDIGGGSAELTVGLNEKVLFSTSLKLGAVRLTNMFFPGAVLSEKGIKSCINYIQNVLLPLQPIIEKIGFDVTVGSSGTAQTACSVISAIKNNTTGLVFNNNVVFTLEDFLLVKETVLSKHNPGERLLIPGIDEKRADIIPAGVLVLNEIFAMLNITEMLISGAALKEGIIQEQINYE